MKLSLNRTYLGQDCTIGTMSVDGVFTCYTCEDTVRPLGDKIYGKTAIPAGEYDVVITHSPRFDRDLPLLLRVPGFEGIRIHPGNIPADTDGCILPGLEILSGFAGVGESRLAFEQLYGKISAAINAHQMVTISVINGAPPQHAVSTSTP